MSRPIEFRAWHRTMKVYCYTHGNPHRKLEFIGGRWVAEFDRGMADFVPDYDVEVEQYTGLTDKQGVKIFEGDRIRMGEMSEADPDDPEGQDYWEDETVYTVVWGGSEYPAFDVTPPYHTECNALSGVVCSHGDEKMEVIGTIHDAETEARG